MNGTADAVPILAGSRIRYQGRPGTVVRPEHVLGEGWTRAVVRPDGDTRTFSVWRDELTKEAV